MTYVVTIHRDYRIITNSGKTLWTLTSLMSVVRVAKDPHGDHAGATRLGLARLNP
jgi:hypothetical protein